mmetsp:Transcript_38428/g.69674  ORF Transcript_38428/g.69674 Transcript_38428/m.69674 type:complete len:202 (+) Transcript_38428:313-918(+)
MSPAGRVSSLDAVAVHSTVAHLAGALEILAGGRSPSCRAGFALCRLAIFRQIPDLVAEDVSQLPGLAHSSDRVRRCLGELVHGDLAVISWIPICAIGEHRRWGVDVNARTGIEVAANALCLLRRYFLDLCTTSFQLQRVQVEQVVTDQQRVARGADKEERPVSLHHHVQVLVRLELAAQARINQKLFLLPRGNNVTELRIN